MPQGRKGHVGLAKEVTAGTPVAVTDYTRIHNETLITAIEEVTPQNIQGVFDEGETYQGLKTHGGDIEFDAHSSFLGWALQGAIGELTTTNPDPAVRWQHVTAIRQVEFSATSVLRPYTFEIHRDLGNAFQFAGNNMDQLELSWGIATKVLTVRIGLMPLKMARIAATSPTFEATRPFLWNECTITLPDPTAFNTIQDIRLLIENNVEGIAFIDGTREYARIRPSGSRRITCSGTMLASSAEFDSFDTRAQRYLKVLFTGAVLGTGNHKLLLDIPLFQYLTYPVQINGPDEIMVGFTGKAVYSAATANTPIRATLDNAKSAY